MTEQHHLANQEVEKSGGSPVEEGPPTTPEQALDQEPDDTGEQRPDRDQAGHEPHDSEPG